MIYKKTNINCQMLLQKLDIITNTIYKNNYPIFKLKRG